MPEILANVYDDTLLRDRVTGWLGDELGFAFTPRGVPVDVVMYGEEYGTHYLGSYWLSENVRIDDNRIDIKELKESDTELPKITGGYLIQNGYQVEDDSPNKFYTKREVCWATDTPSFDPNDGYINDYQKTYIQEYVQSLEDILFEEGLGYRDYFDIESTAKYWLVQMFTMNKDAYGTGSTYFYKDRDVNGEIAKVYWGPLWDFDFAWDDNYGEPEGFETDHDWLRPMLWDKAPGGVMEEVKNQWPLLRSKAEELIADGGVIDKYALETKASAEADRAIYDPLYHDQYDYLKEVNDLKEWIRKRIDWIDAHFNELDTLISKVSLVVDDEVYKSEYAWTGRTLETNINVIVPLKDGYVFKGWLDEDGNPFNPEERIMQDKVYTAQFIKEEDAILAEDIVFRRDRIDIPYSYFVTKHQIEYELLPTDTDETFVSWTSSNPSFATVSLAGEIYYHGEGEAIITATLRNGKSKSLVFTVSKEPTYPAETITPDKDVIEMLVGEEDYFTITTDPERTYVDKYTYESLDESVATVDEFGIIKAVGPGKTQIHLTIASFSNYPDCYVTVIVSKPEAISYTISEGKTNTWERGSGKEVTIVANRSEEDETCFDHFTDVLIDGEILELGADYNAKQGSTIITLLPNALERFSDGEHDVLIKFDDGEVSAKLNIITKEKPNDDVTPTPTPSNDRKPGPDTGDKSLAIWYVLLLTSILITGISTLYKRRYRDN